jgi:hypothetical protein
MQNVCVASCEVQFSSVCSYILGAAWGAGYRPSIEKGLFSVHAQQWEKEQARLESEDHANYSLVQDLLSEAAKLDGHNQDLHDLVRSGAAAPAHCRTAVGCPLSVPSKRAVGQPASVPSNRCRTCQGRRTWA